MRVGRANEKAANAEARGLYAGKKAKAKGGGAGPRPPPRHTSEELLTQFCTSAWRFFARASLIGWPACGRRHQGLHLSSGVRHCSGHRLSVIQDGLLFTESPLSTDFTIS